MMMNRLVFQRVLMQRTRGFSSKTDPISLVGADQSMAMQNIFHKTSLSLLVITPIAFLVPQQMTMPFDILMAIAFPLHAHIGLNWIITDYLPGVGPKGALRYGLVGVTAVTLLGLLKVSTGKDGLVGTVKATWKGSK